MSMKTRVLSMTLTYAICGLVLLLLSVLWKDLRLFLCAAAMLVLTAVQTGVYLRARRSGLFKPVHEQLCLGPTYAIIAAFWFHKYLAEHDTRGPFFGLAFLALTVIWTLRVIRAIRLDRESGPFQ